MEAPPVPAKMDVMQKQALIHGGASNAFIQKQAPCIQGVLAGFDRLRLRGTLRQLYCPQVMEAYLNACRVLIKDFGQLVEKTTLAVKAKAKELAQKAGRPLVFVSSSQTSKEDLARQMAARDGVTEGLICILNAVEPCQSFRVCGNPQTKKIELRVAVRSSFMTNKAACCGWRRPWFVRKSSAATAARKESPKKRNGG